MINLHHCKNEYLFPSIADESLDIICIDPPYKYLKNQKLEVDFDETLFFNNCKRVLKKTGFIIMFGRGTSFYRWNTMLADLGFVFKEEIVWDKMQTSSPFNSISRIHETVSIYAKNSGNLNKVKIPFVEANRFDPKKIIEAIYRITTTFGNRKTFDILKNYFESNIKDFKEDKQTKHLTTVKSNTKSLNRTLAFAVSVEEGIMERSIIKQTRDHYSSIHPTQKPVRLLERLMQLCFPKTPESKIIIADFFGGSFSTMEAVMNLSKTYPEIEFEGLSCEMDEEYFKLGQKRILSLDNSHQLEMAL